MQTDNIPGQIPHTPPGSASQSRLQSLLPYVREAQESFRPAWTLRSRKLFDYLIINLIEGSGVFTIDGTTYTANAGDLFWIPPNILHTLKGNTPGTRMQHIHFDLIYEPQRSHWCAHIPGGTTDLSPWPDRMHPPVNDPIIGNWNGKMQGYNPARATELLHHIILDYNRSQTSNLAVAGGMLQLIDHLLGSRHNDSSLDARHVKAIERAMRQIQMHSEERLNIEALARENGLSPTHFRRLFRKHYQQSPRDAHLAAKIRRAGNELIYSDLSVTEIAYQLGFTNVHNFSRAFRKATGHPPTMYRKGR